MLLGSWNIDEIKSVNLPQKVASAFTAITGGLVGAEYQPVLYVGKQVVNGTNYCVLAFNLLLSSAFYGIENRVIAEFADWESGG